MSTRVFWAITVPLLVVCFVVGAVGLLTVTQAVVLAVQVAVVMFGVDAVLNVRRSWVAYRDRGDWPGES